MSSTLRRLRDRLGVRAVSALAAAAAVAVVLVVAGIALVLGLQRTLTSSVEETAKGTAEQLGQRIEANFSGTGDPKKNAIDATGKRTDIVQVVTAYSDETNAPDSVVGSNGEQEDIQVIGSSDPLGSRPQIVPWLLAPGETRTAHDVEIRKVDDTVENALVFGEGFRANGRPITVYAAEETRSVSDAVDTVQWLLVGGIPVLVLITGYFTYLFAGGALRPVDRMRARVAGMSEKDLSQRVPEPVANDEVGRLARTMNQMLGRIESSQATQRRFVADASHELRSPLATVSTGLELLGSGMREDSPDRATVQTLRGEATRLTGLVEGLLFLARADERGLAPRREEVDLDEIVEAERVRPAAPSGDPAVTVRVTTEPVRVVGDRGQLVRVVRNLVDNAKRHAASTVAVAVRAEDGVAVIEVDDDGNGVPGTDRDRVFERFVRLDEARSRGDGGSGLGLSIVAELVTAHGGTVAALDSPELGGARFRVTVPIAAPVHLDPDPDRSLDQSADPEPAPAASGAAGAAGVLPAGTFPAGADAGFPGTYPGEAERDPWTGLPIDPPAPPAPSAPVAAPGAELKDDRPSGPLPRIRPIPDGAGRPSRAAGPAGPAAPTGSSETVGTTGPAGSDGPADAAGSTGATGHGDPATDAPTVRPVMASRPPAPADGGPDPDGRRHPAGAANGDAGPEDAPAGHPAPTTPAPTTTAPTTPAPEVHPVPDPQARHRPDPPTGPLPIRPNTVGSPYDENVTRPLPVPGSSAATRPTRSGTAVAPRDDRSAEAPRPAGRTPPQSRPSYPRGRPDDRR
ncbi:ATP-binding protein [Pseudonocardia nantongensis]|uniref:ATP-binding protein n=1 Tax=Pseudonocardia nantongensis TaxID=1181885 RepID=UPI00397C0D44